MRTDSGMTCDDCGNAITGCINIAGALHLCGTCYETRRYWQEHAGLLTELDVWKSNYADLRAENERLRSCLETCRASLREVDGEKTCTS